MITADDVLSVLSSNYDTSDYPIDTLYPFCSIGLDWVLCRLKSGVAADNPLIATTAAAIARFHFSTQVLSEPDKYESYRVGDISITNNPSKAYEREKQLRDYAVAQAAPILTDGGFFCCGK